MQGRTGKEDILGFSFNLCVLPAGLRLHEQEGQQTEAEERTRAAPLG